LLAGLPRLHEVLVFPARGKDNPASGFSKWKRELDERSGVVNWRIHDLRRTAASGMAQLAVPPHIIERVLNHTTGTLGGVAGIYNRYGYLAEMRGALEHWSGRVGELTSK
jgi:integrase